MSEDRLHAMIETGKGTPAGILHASAAAMPKRREKPVAREISFAAFTIRAAASFIISLAVIWAYVAAFPMAYQARDYPLQIAKATLAAQCHPGIVAVFGDSRAVASVIPAAMPTQVENLALSGTTPIETYFMVKRLLNCAALPRLVVLAHSASMYTSDDYFWQFDALTGFLTSAELHEVVDAANLQGDHELETAKLPQGVPYGALPALYGIHFPALYFSSLINGYVAGRWAYNRHVLNDVIASSGHALFGTALGADGAADEASIQDWQVSPLINLYFTRTLAMLAARHVPVVLITMPVNAATCRQMPPNMAPGFAAYLQGITPKYSNIVMMDPKIGCWPDHYFGDNWHFNQSGAEAYTKYLQTLLAPWLRTSQKGLAANE